MGEVTDLLFNTGWRLMNVGKHRVQRLARATSSQSEFNPVYATIR